MTLHLTTILPAFSIAIVVLHFVMMSAVVLVYTRTTAIFTGIGCYAECVDEYTRLFSIKPSCSEKCMVEA